MRIFANGLNRHYLRDILPGEGVQIDWVKAAIAYGDDEETLLRNCLLHRRRMDIWMRYDHTVPVAPSLLRSLLRSAPRNIFCRLVPDVLHSKVIWWKGHGVYIGSANLTDRAWMRNIELGMFLAETELEALGGLGEIESFFYELDCCDVAFDLTDKIIREQESILKARSQLDDKADSEARLLRSVKQWEGPDFIAAKESALERRRASFVKEWQGGAEILREIARLAPLNRPEWLNDDVPATWQADQFLHAYYYNCVVDGPSHPYEEYYQKNLNDPAAATIDALKWWKALDLPPSNEDFHCHVQAPLIRNILSKNNIGSMALEDFCALLKANHSSWDHIRRMTAERLESSGEMDADERISAFARILWGQKNAKGQSVAELIEFVLDGGRQEDIASRLFSASDEFGFPHFGKNQLSEMAGWARPEKFSPRNGRTSKALRALGYNVKVY